MSNRSNAARSVQSPGFDADGGLRADIEAALARHADQHQRIAHLASSVRSLAASVPGLREAYISQQADEIIFVGDDWNSLSDKVSELLDAIGLALDPSGGTFIRGGLYLTSGGLQGYTQVSLG